MTQVTFIDRDSAPGSWARHIRDTNCMRRYSRCEISGWHPEARTCALPACELRVHAADASGVELPIPVGSTPAVALYGDHAATIGCATAASAGNGAANSPTGDGNA